MKVREGSVKGNVKALLKNCKTSQSVKVREGNVKGHVKLFRAVILSQSVKVREGNVKVPVKHFLTCLFHRAR